MKAFRFGLEQARRWRAAQVAIEKSRVAAAAVKLADIKAAIENLRAQLRDGAAEVSTGSNGTALDAWASWSGRSRRQISEWGKTESEAERALEAATLLLADADRKLRILDNLKDTEFARWRRDFDCELENFASEAFLARLHSRTF